MKHTLRRYEHTIYAGYLGYITQAIVNNFAPLLFLTFASEFKLTMVEITLITTINFLVQLFVDLLCTKLIDKIGYRVSIVTAHIFASVGFVFMAAGTHIMENKYVGLIISVVLYAIGGGIIEVMVSPIVEACPTEKKESQMSLLHSFYCIGHILVVLMSTLFFRVAGIENWRILSVLWALIPLANAVYFMYVPLFDIVGEHEKTGIRGFLKNKVFWILMVLMVCAGAAEQAMSQWASTFAELSFNMEKTAGDLAGPMLFAAFMGIARTIYGKYGDKINLHSAIKYCAIICIMAYMLATLVDLKVAGIAGCALCGFSVGIFWPGTFSIVAKVLKSGGTAVFAFMALAGDFGCAFGPTMTGFISDNTGNFKIGLLVAVIFPILIIAGISMLKKQKG